MATADIQSKDETKLANGGGAFPFWVSVAIESLLRAGLLRLQGTLSNPGTPP